MLLGKGSVPGPETAKADKALESQQRTALEETEDGVDEKGA